MKRRREPELSQVGRCHVERPGDRADGLNDPVRVLGRVGVALALGEELELPPARLDALRFGALFHDIGKIAVPDGILIKPSKLNYWEYAQMKTHSAEGARIVGKFGRLREAVPIIRHHHERWDGAGYPDGLAGERIPLASRIIAACDAYHAMTSDRPYRRAMSAERALGELRANAGSQFDPTVVAQIEMAVVQPAPLV